MERTAFLPTDIGRHNWGDLFTNTPLWQEVVTRICRETGVSAAHAVRAGYPGSCAVFIVDQSVVVKLYPPMFGADFDREIVVYGAIEGRLPHIPRLLAKGIYQDRIDWPYIILEFCPGEPIREVHDRLSDFDKLRIGSELGMMIRRLHDIVPPAEIAISWPTWASFLQANRERTLNHLRENRPFPPFIIDEIETFLAATEVEWRRKRPLCLINADLTQDHLLLVKQENQWHVSALIDWADAEVGLPDYEWIPLWYGLCQQEEDFLLSILSAYDPAFRVDNSFCQGLLAYTFLHRFGGEIVLHTLNERGNPDIQNLADLQFNLFGHLAYSRRNLQ